MGQIVSTVTTTRGQITMQMNAIASSLFAFYGVIDATDSNSFGTYLKSFAQISLTSTCRRPAISYVDLVTHWDIHPNCAMVTVQWTTQRGVNKIANPALS